MQKYLYLFLFVFCTYFFSFGQSQLTTLNRIEASVALKFLKSQSEIILYSGCERNDIGRKIKLSSVKMTPSNDKKGYFNIKITGNIVSTFNIRNQKISNFQKKALPEYKKDLIIDLTYVHIASGGYYNSNKKYIWTATCLGIYLGLHCDPCKDPFEYPNFGVNN